MARQTIRAKTWDGRTLEIHFAGDECTGVNWLQPEAKEPIPTEQKSQGGRETRTPPEAQKTVVREQVSGGPERITIVTRQGRTTRVYTTVGGNCDNQAGWRKKQTWREAVLSRCARTCAREGLEARVHQLRLQRAWMEILSWSQPDPKRRPRTDWDSLSQQLQQSLGDCPADTSTKPTPPKGEQYP